MLQLIINLALLIGVSLTNSTPENVPTSLCHDPLLGPSMIIHTDCNDKPVQDREDNTIILHSVDNTPPVVVVVNPPVDNNEDNPPSPPVQDNKQKCNNGFGNGQDNACKTHGNAQNQDETGTHQNGKDMSKQTDKSK